MIEKQLSGGPVSTKLADAIRSVNAAHNRTGAGENPDLQAAWVRLDRALQLSVVAGDDRAAHLAVDRYRREGLAAVADQAERLARKERP